MPRTVNNTPKAWKVTFFMLRNQLTHKTIAKKLGVSQAYVTNVLNDRMLGLELRERLVSEIGMPRGLVYSGLLRKSA